MVREIIFETILGAVTYLNTTKVSPQKFVKLVSSPGGTTEAGIKLLKNKRFTNIIVQCLDSASKKSAKISDKLIMNKN
jgi:pyrroline-5-carboxylate reductase